MNPDLAHKTNAELEEMQQRAAEEIRRRQIIDAAPSRIDAIAREALHAAGYTEGDPWTQPHPVGFPLGWRTTHNGANWVSTTANNVWEPDEYGWELEDQ